MIQDSTVELTLPEHFSTDKATPQSTTPQEDIVYALVGNPNCGKTTLFNQLTGLRQKVANYPGVTVEKKTGICFSQHGKKIPIIDLPGAYSLTPTSPDEEILLKALLGQVPGTPKPNRILCVLDATNLERNLFLASQVIELGIPTILVLNMMDIAKKRGIFIDTGHLERQLGVKVIPTQATNRKSLHALRIAMSQSNLPTPKQSLTLPKPVANATLTLHSHLIKQDPNNLSHSHNHSLLLLTQEAHRVSEDPLTQKIIESLQEELDSKLTNWRSLIIQARYQNIDDLIAEGIHKGTPRSGPTLTEQVDKVVLNKTFGWLPLLLIMSSLFTCVFWLSETPMNWVENGFQNLAIYVSSIMPTGPLQGLICDGIIAGVGSVLVFLPQIIILFAFIGILESSGYLPRAAFLLDSFMSKIGLSGKAFIPLLSSYACAVPGIMATRTIASPKQRLATIMVAPWMSCSARLPIYLLMISALLPQAEGSVWVKSGLLILAYSIGTLGAVAVAWILHKFVLKTPKSTSMMELPPYRMPSWINIFHEVKQRTVQFLKRAGKLILAFSVILWFLMAYPKTATEGTTHSIEHSYLAKIGKTVEPIFEPLGYDWKISSSILSSFAARELFVSTLAIFNNVDPENSESNLGQSLRAKPEFTALTCLSLLVFFIFAMQCFSTLVVTYRETRSLAWTIFQFVYMTAFAYLAALLTYQLGGLLWMS